MQQLLNRLVLLCACAYLPCALYQRAQGAIPGFIFESEPVFAKEVGYHGQAVGIVLATSQQAALRAASLAVVEVDPPETPAVVTAAQALACNAVYDLPRVLPMYAPGEAPGSVRLGHAAGESCVTEAW